MIVINSPYLTEEFIFFFGSVLYILFSMERRWKWIFGISYSTTPFVITHFHYGNRFRPYSFDFYINYFLVFTFLILIVNFLMSRYSAKITNSRDPYTLMVQHDGRVYYGQFGIYKFNNVIHSSLENFEPIRLELDGSFVISDSSKKLIQLLHSYINQALKTGNIKIILTKLPSDNQIHHRFLLLAQTKTQSIEDFYGLDQLDVSEPRFSKIQLYPIPTRIIRNILSADREGNLVFDVTELHDSHPNQFEMGIYEFDLLIHLVREYNNRKIEVPHSIGTHYIGSDLRKNPVFMEQPYNLLFIGMSDYLPQITDFEFIQKNLIVTDDQKLIAKVYRRDPEKTHIKSMQNLRINLIEYGLKHPKFLESLLEFWAFLLPDDNKAEFRKSLIKLISQFVELKYLLDGEDAVSQLMTRDLLLSKTYREFNIDISTEVLTKFKGLLDRPEFNGFKQEILDQGVEVEHLADFLSTDKIQIGDEDINYELKNWVIDISGLSERQKQAMFILICLMKEQAMIPSHWVTLSLKRTDRLNDSILKQLAKYLNYRNIILHLGEVGNDLSWIRSFDCVVHDKHLNHRGMRKYLNIEKNRSVDGLYVYQSFGRKTILQVQIDGE